MQSSYPEEDNLQQSDFAEIRAQQFTEMEARANEGVPLVPSLESIAFYVLVQRGFWGWKQEALAAMTGVSLSTVERVERGEVVASESLNRIAVALRQPPGAFTTPRIPFGVKEVLRMLSKKHRTLRR